MDGCHRAVRCDQISLTLDVSITFWLFQHSCYDGSISASFKFWQMVSMLQKPEPNWDDLPSNTRIPIELKFDLDDHMVNEIKSTCQEVEETVSTSLQ